tara:strand:+ start:111 stop:290 length:180 start_codon:yes stop_codon:yes gene_type:complete
MIVKNNGKSVGVPVEYWKSKTFEEFEKAFKGKILSSNIKKIYDSFAVKKPKKVKEVKDK